MVTVLTALSQVYPLQLDGEQPVLEPRGSHLDPIGKCEAAFESAGRDAAVEKVPDPASSACWPRTTSSPSSMVTASSSRPKPATARVMRSRIPACPRPPPAARYYRAGSRRSAAISRTGGSPRSGAVSPSHSSPLRSVMRDIVRKPFHLEAAATCRSVRWGPSMAPCKTRAQPVAALVSLEPLSIW